MQVIFDGQYLNVRLNTKIYKHILNITEEAPYFEYLYNSGIMCLPPTKRIAKKLFELGLSFDITASVFFDYFMEKTIKNGQVKNEPDFSLLKPLELRPYQKDGVNYMLSSNKNFLLGDEMGLGKSVQIASYLFYKQAFPALIICPASLKLNWEREIGLWAKKKCLVLEGLTPYPIQELLNEFPVVIINYDILGRKDKKGIKEESERVREAKKRNLPYKKKKTGIKGWVALLKEINFKNIIVDECQFIGEEETARTQSVIGIVKSKINRNARFIPLSGTPYTSAAEQFFTALHLIDPAHFDNRWKYKFRFCDPVHNGYGWVFKGLSNGEQLHNLVSKIMLRRLKKDVAEDLPEKIKSIVPMKLDKKYLQSYKENEKVLLSDNIKNGNQTYQDLKRGAYYAKHNSCITWVKEYLEINNKLVVIVYHREAFDQIMKEFSRIAVGINGTTPSNKRQGIVDSFKNDNNIKLFCGQIRSAGVGITLTAASGLAFIEFGDTASEHLQAEDRIHRETQTAERVLIFYLIAQNTIDEDIIDKIKTGYENQKKVLDGEKNAQFLSDSPADFAKSVLNARKEKVIQFL